VPITEDLQQRLSSLLSFINM